MKKSTTIIIILAAIAVAVGWGVKKYNSFVASDEAVSAQWAQVESAYQRRSDLIPNLVQTVKGYASHEENTLTEVIEARAKASQITVDPAKLTSESVSAYQAAQGEISAAIGRLLVVKESYPDLKANQNFLELQAQLEGTENRINVERQNFNNLAKEYNVAIRKFPASIIASIGGFEAKGYFQADAEAQKAPKVSFD